jgi:hypothetical protein
VSAGDVATPEPSVVAVALVGPPNVADAPLPGAAKVTLAPLTGFPLPSRTAARSGAPNAVLTAVLCGAPEETATDAGALGVPPRIRTLIGAAGAVGVEPPWPGTTNSVMVWVGSDAVIVPPDAVVSASRVIALLDDSRHTWIAPDGVKFESRKFTEGATDRSLLIAMMVSAPVPRCAAKTDSESGLGAVAATLVSPNPDPCPS